uniref:Uncharacterized protein n=1 Tax=Meloidogyne hapla TaxID=6305 RepID=A0A1I8BD02_MELHA
MSQALLSKSLQLRVFWWMVLVLCTCCGTATTVLVIIEYIRGPTASSTTIRLDELPEFNQTYMHMLGQLYDRWRRSIDTKQFFHEIQEKFGYKCTDLFDNCELGGKKHNCCDALFRSRPVMRRGLCYQTKPQLNQAK